MNYKSHREVPAVAQIFLGINSKGIELPKYGVTISPRDQNYDSEDIENKFN